MPSVKHAFGVIAVIASRHISVACSEEAEGAGATLLLLFFFFIRGALALADVRVGHPRSVEKSICVVRFPRLGRVPARGRGPDALPVQDYSFRIGASRVDAPVDDGFEVGVDVSHARATGGNAVAGVVVQHDVHV